VLGYTACRVYLTFVRTLSVEALRDNLSTVIVPVLPMLTDSSDNATAGAGAGAGAGSGAMSRETTVAASSVASTFDQRTREVAAEVIRCVESN